MRSKKHPSNPPKTKPKISLFTTTEVGTLIENFQSEFRVFGDQLLFIKDKVEAIEATQAKTWEKITEIDLRLIRVERKVDSLERKVDSLERKVDAIEKEITAIKTELKEIRNHLETKADRAELKNLQTRVTTLEKQMELLLTR